jgi:hypothetical protein
MARKFRPRVIRAVAAALVVGTLTLGCQAAGGSTHAAARPAHPATAAAATKTVTKTATQAQPASPVPPGPGPFASDATDRKLATALAAAIQRAFTPPPGSRKLGGLPPGTWRDLGVPGGVISTDGEVFVSSWWQVPGQPQAVLKWLQAHEPRPWYGGGRGSFGPVAEPGDVTPAGQRPADVYTEWNDTFENFHAPAVIGAEQLIVEESRMGPARPIRASIPWSPGGRRARPRSGCRTAPGS